MRNNAQIYFIIRLGLRIMIKKCCYVLYLLIDNKMKINSFISGTNLKGKIKI